MAIKAKSLYSLHPSFKTEEASLKKLHERTGRSLDQWIAFVKKEGPKPEKERREWLKRCHGLTTNYAWWVAERAEGRGAADDYDPDALVDAMFSGGKAALRKVYDALLKLGLSMGKDVKACPCETIVPLYRKNVFAQIKPSTLTRIDFGFALGDTKAKGRLIDTGGYAKKDRITHRIPITAVSEIDAEVRRWLKAAYDRTEPGEPR
jgi:hypothetical protein